MLPDINPAMQGWMDFDKHLLVHADKAGGDGGLRAITLFAVSRFVGRDRDNPSLRGLFNENYEKRMELI